MLSLCRIEDVGEDILMEYIFLLDRSGNIFPLGFIFFFFLIFLIKQDQCQEAKLPKRKMHSNYFCEVSLLGPCSIVWFLPKKKRR